MKKTKWQAKCRKPGCDWQSDEVFLAVVARNAAKRHERKAGKRHHTEIEFHIVEEEEGFFLFR